MPRPAATARVLACLGASVLVLALANAALGTQQFPNYATWTGIRPLEEKLSKLADFSRSRSPDAVILGSSIADFGFSAETFSQLVARQTGRDYRVFNFSSGATEIVTLPKVYRLVRTVSSPRELLLVIRIGAPRPNQLAVQSPDYIMSHAPVGIALDNPALLAVDKQAWDLPLLRDSAAVRDVLLYGRFASLPGQGSDLYPITTNGDSLSFNYQISDAQLQSFRASLVTQFQALTDRQLQAMSDADILHYYFNDIDVAAMRELRQLTTSDGVRITIVAHAPAASFYPEPITEANYFIALRQAFMALSSALNARLILDLEGMTVQPYQVNDVVHLNRYGARVFAARVAARYLDDPSVASAEPTYGQDSVPVLESVPARDESVNQFASLIPAPDDANARTLRLTLVSNHAVPALPASNVSLAVRTPDGQDHLAPIVRERDGTIRASLSDLRPRGTMLLLVRLVQDVNGRRVALNQPIAGYAWAAS